MKRQEFWLKKGYTKENIECHLNFERRKAKESRKKRKSNNLKNKDLIKQIKKELLGNTFKQGDLEVKILSIRPSVDGKGFWYKMNKKFSDGSSGDFRQFSYFSEYNELEFVKYLFY